MQARVREIEPAPFSTYDRTLAMPSTPFALPSPWLRRTLQFLQAWTLSSGNSIAMLDMAPLFTLAPIGSLATTVDDLCRMGCLVPVDDASFLICTRASSPYRRAQH